MKRLVMIILVALMMSACVTMGSNKPYQSDAYFDRGNDAHVTAETAELN